VLVVGAGIAGLATALASSRAGCEVEVVERHGDLAELAAGLTLWPNALRALDGLGGGGEVREESAAVVSGGFQRPDGSWLKRMDSDITRTALGEPLAVIARGELLGILARAVSDVPIRRGTAARRWRGVAGSVEVELADGTIVSAHAVVGADGIHSAMAYQLHPDSRLRYAGYTAWRGVASTRLAEMPASETWGPGGAFGYLPMAGDRTYWFATQEHARASVLRRRRPPAPAGTLRVLAPAHPRPDRRHGPGGEPAQRIGNSPEPPSAFTTFEQARRQRVRRIARQSSLLARIIQGESLSAALGRAAFAHIPEAMALRQMAQVGGTARFAVPG
jgi:2-polyprenyl-6-methoxyphenol hydroxylase-like FAD-dependent oxidoreductase